MNVHQAGDKVKSLTDALDIAVDALEDAVTAERTNLQQEHEAQLQMERLGVGPEDMFRAFEAGFVLGRQPSPLPGPYGRRLRNAFDRWAK